MCAMLKLNIVVGFMLSMCAMLVVATSTNDGTVGTTSSDSDGEIAACKFGKFVVSKVVGFSSQYSTTSWSAEQVIGEPNVYPQYGDIAGAWAPSTTGQKEYLELEFPKSVRIGKISVYETYHGGAITKIGIWNAKKESYKTVYEGEAQDIQESRIFEPDITSPRFLSNRIRLDLDGSVSGSWCEIDAVEITKKKCM